MTIKNRLLPPESERRARAHLLKHTLKPPQFSWRSPESFSEPFFIVGSGRCGTTLLRRLLQASPEIHIPPENWAMDSWIHQFRDYRSLLQWSELSGLLLGNQLLNNQGWFDCCPVELLDGLTKLPEKARTLADFIDYLYRFHGYYIGAEFRYWGDKTPRNVSYMFSIRKLFPKARFIFMLRDPADVVYSWSKRRNYFNEVERPALRWKQAFQVARAFENKYKNQIIQVRYENLVMQPETEMGRISGFLGIQYDNEWLNRKDHFSDLQDAKGIAHLQAALDGISGNSVGKGRGGLNKTHLETLQSYIGATALEAGYPGFVSN